VRFEVFIAETVKTVWFAMPHGVRNVQTFERHLLPAM